MQATISTTCTIFFSVGRRFAAGQLSLSLSLSLLSLPLSLSLSLSLSLFSPSLPFISPLLSPSLSLSLTLSPTHLSTDRRCAVGQRAVLPARHALPGPPQVHERVHQPLVAKGEGEGWQCGEHERDGRVPSLACGFPVVVHRLCLLCVPVNNGQ